MFARRSCNWVLDISSRIHIVSRHKGGHHEVYRRNLSSENSKLCAGRPASSLKILCEQLRSRGLIRVAGPTAPQFLQGLITNDMQHFEQHSTGSMSSSMYSLLLNHQGRLLYDIVIYSLTSCSVDVDRPPAFLVECDARIEADLRRHLNTFNIRKKIDVSSFSADYHVWALFPADHCRLHLEEEKEENSQILPVPIVDELLPAMSHEPCKSKGHHHQLAFVRDPRLASFCSRLVLHASKTPQDIFSPQVQVNSIEQDVYTRTRYRFGIAEGSLELPPANCFPLECNGDYLHGVSFQKGCYVGQELTSRTHHTGVVRKRIMPLVLSSPLDMIDKSSIEVSVKNERGKVVGKVRGSKGRFAVGLMRIEQSLQPDTKLYCQVPDDDSGLKIDVQVHKPFWWPIDQASKENLAAKQE